MANNNRRRENNLKRQDVQEAIEKLKKEGITNPTLRDLRATLGNRGSFDTIARFKAEILEGKPPVQTKGDLAARIATLESLVASQAKQIATIMEEVAYLRRH